METMKQTKGNIVKHIFSRKKNKKEKKKRNKIKSKQKIFFFYSSEIKHT
jgi:hypothetical protein